MSEYLASGAMPVDLTDETTGEVRHGVWIPDDEDNRDFVRYFCKHTKGVFVRLLSTSTDKKMHVLAYLIDVMSPSDNRIAVTYKKIAQKLELPESTVYNAMTFLQDFDFVRMIQNGLWMINPDLCMKGYESKYLKLSREYISIETKISRVKERSNKTDD